MGDYGSWEDDEYFEAHKHEYSGRSGPGAGPIGCFFGAIFKIIGFCIMIGCPPIGALVFLFGVWLRQE